MVTPSKFQFKFFVKLKQNLSLRMLLPIAAAIISAAFPVYSHAQAAATGTTANRNVKRSVATILFSTIGGAALGLSTLSFYGEPQEHTDNITVGALLGLIVGTTYVAYDSAKPAPKSNDYYGVFDQDQKSRRALASNTKAPPTELMLMKFDFSF